MPMQEQRCLFGTYLCIEDGDTAEGELESELTRPQPRHKRYAGPFHLRQNRRHLDLANPGIICEYVVDM